MIYTIDVERSVILMSRQKVETVRLSVNIPSDLVKRIDEYGARLNINRTSAICVLCNMSLDSYKALDDMGSLASVMRDFKNET